MPDIVTGIDPGVTGGIASMTLDGDVFDVAVLPVVKVGGKTELDAAALAAFVRSLQGRCTVRLAAVEKVGARPGQGVCSMFSFGACYGGIRGVLAALSVPVELPTPQAWQKLILCGMPPAEDTKTLSVAYCARRFPGLSLRATDRSRKAHHGIADAVCLAEYARRIACGTRKYD